MCCRTVLILTVMSREPFGPLSDARTGILPTSFGAHHRLDGTLLILMPLLLQLTLADGLRRRRRAAAVGKPNLLWQEIRKKNILKQE